MKGKAALLVVSGIAVVAASSYLLSIGPEGQPDRGGSADTPSLGAPDVTIRVTASGFVPTTTVVARGAVVEFINDSPRDVWPASDLHPTHDAYPAFDPRQPIGPGSSWKFRFEKEGEWRMHDHLFPSRRGVIEVLE